MGWNYCLLSVILSGAVVKGDKRADSQSRACRFSDDRKATGNAQCYQRADADNSTFDFYCAQIRGQ